MRILGLVAGQAMLETVVGSMLAARAALQAEFAKLHRALLVLVRADVTNDMTIAREEIFGPVLTILGYHGEEEPITIGNDTPYGLAAYVQGEPVYARKVARQLRAGQVNINGAGIDFMAPFGGYKQSGNDREWGNHAFGEFLEIKAIVGYGEEAASG